MVSTKREKQHERLYIGGLSDNVSNSDIFNLLRSFGEVKNVTVTAHAVPKKGFAHLSLCPKDATSIERCLKTLNGTRWKGGVLKIALAKMPSAWDPQSAELKDVLPPKWAEREREKQCKSAESAENDRLRKNERLSKWYLRQKSRKSPVQISNNVYEPKLSRTQLLQKIHFDESSFETEKESKIAHLWKSGFSERTKVDFNSLDSESSGSKIELPNETNIIVSSISDSTSLASSSESNDLNLSKEPIENDDLNFNKEQIENDDLNLNKEQIENDVHSDASSSSSSSYSKITDDDIKSDPDPNALAFETDSISDKQSTQTISESETNTDSDTDSTICESSSDSSLGATINDESPKVKTAIPATKENTISSVSQVQTNLRQLIFGNSVHTELEKDPNLISSAETKSFSLLKSLGHVDSPNTETSLKENTLGDNTENDRPCVLFISERQCVETLRDLFVSENCDRTLRNCLEELELPSDHSLLTYKQIAVERVRATSKRKRNVLLEELEAQDMADDDESAGNNSDAEQDMKAEKKFRPKRVLYDSNNGGHLVTLDRKKFEALYSENKKIWHREWKRKHKAYLRNEKNAKEARNKRTVI